MRYDPYGQFTLTVQDGHSATGNPYLFQGRRWDDEVSLYYFRNRVMSPVLGRSLQRDPAAADKSEQMELRRSTALSSRLLGGRCVWWRIQLDGFRLGLQPSDVYCSYVMVWVWCRSDDGCRCVEYDWDYDLYEVGICYASFKLLEPLSVYSMPEEKCPNCERQCVKVKYEYKVGGGFHWGGVPVGKGYGGSRTLHVCAQ